MASSASISGLASGLDTESIINSLIALEGNSQTLLKKKASSEQSLVTTLQTLNTKAALLGSKAAALAKASAWTVNTATTTNAAITATAGATSSATRLDISVTSVARSHQLGFTDAAQLGDAVTGTSTTVSLARADGTQVSLETGTGTLAGLVAAINDPANATGLNATTIKTSSGYRLLVESTQTGAAQSFTLTRADGTALLGGATVRAGSDAAISLGAGITATSSTNTFTGLTTGVDVTLSPDTAVGATTTIVVRANTAKLSSSVGELVDSMNALLSEIDTQTAYNAEKKTSGPLASDAGVRNLRNAVLTSVYPTDGTSLATIGIQTDRFGKVTFDAARFATAYAADPTGVAARFTTAADGFAERLDKVADSASDPTTGTLTSSINNHKSGIKTLETNIEAWDVRLALRRESLTRTYSALETALNKLSSQSSWLSGQIAQLPSSS